MLNRKRSTGCFGLNFSSCPNTIPIALFRVTCCAIIAVAFAGESYASTITETGSAPTGSPLEFNDPSTVYTSQFKVNLTSESGQTFEHTTPFTLSSLHFKLGDDTSSLTTSNLLTLSIYTDFLSAPGTNILGSTLVGTVTGDLGGVGGSLKDKNYLNIALTPTESASLGTFAANKQYALVLTTSTGTNDLFIERNATPNDYLNGTGVFNGSLSQQAVPNETNHYDTKFYVFGDLVTVSTIAEPASLTSALIVALVGIAYGLCRCRPK